MANTRLPVAFVVLLLLPFAGDERWANTTGPLCESSRAPEQEFPNRNGSAATFMQRQEDLTVGVRNNPSN